MAVIHITVLTPPRIDYLTCRSCGTVIVLTDLVPPVASHRLPICQRCGQIW